MDRAFDQLEEAFFRSGAVLSAEDANCPSRPTLCARGSGPIGATFHETVQLGLKQTVELGGYFTGYVIDGPGEAEEYEELSIDIYIDIDLELA